LKTDNEVTFNKLAHTIPKSIGGKEICSNVCDACNHFFGTGHNSQPAIETVIKETFNITRAKLLEPLYEIGKNKTLTHFTSVYFNVNFINRSISVKPAFRLKKGFQETLCRQFKKGLFKIFLEETERQNRNGLDKKFDFIREFCRYDLGEYPVFYFPRKNGVILSTAEDIQHPKFYFYPRMNFYIMDYNFFEFEFIGHLFSIPISRYYKISIDNYLNKSIPIKIKYFNEPIIMKYLTQIDLTLDIMNK
jgi:hypothetical protein